MNELEGFLGGTIHEHFMHWMLQDRSRNFKRFDANHNYSLTVDEVRRHHQSCDNVTFPYRPLISVSLQLHWTKALPVSLVNNIHVLHLGMMMNCAV